MNDRHAARMLAFIYYCLDTPVAQIAGLVGGSIATVTKWKETDDWDKWRPALQSYSATKGVPLWATKMLGMQDDLKKQVKALQTALAAREKAP